MCRVIADNEVVQRGFIFRQDCRNGGPFLDMKNFKIQSVSGLIIFFLEIMKEEKE